MTRIRMSPSASITIMPRGVVLRSDLGTFQLEGEDIQVFVNAMVPLLDGSHDREDVAANLIGYSRESILAFLDLLESRGLLESVADTPNSDLVERRRGQEAFFRKWSDSPERAVEKLGQARVLVLGLEPWGVVTSVELAAAGVGTLLLLDDGVVTRDDLLSVRVWDSQHVGRPRGEALAEVLSGMSPWCRVAPARLTLGDDRSLVVGNIDWDLAIGSVAADDLLLLRSLARFAHKAQIPSLYGCLEGLDAVIGPAVIPGQTACWNCCRLRQLGNADHVEATHAFQSSLLAERPRPRIHTYLAPMSPMVGHLLALEALKLLTRYTPSFLTGRLYVQNLVSFESGFHTVAKVPWCEVCGDAGDTPGQAEEPTLGGRGTPETGRRTQRLNDIDDPQDLRHRLSGLVDRRTGIVGHLVRGEPDAMELELPVTYSAVLASRVGRTCRPEEPEIGSGKGLSCVEAMIGAVGEAVERYSAAWCRRGDLLRAPFDQIRVDAFDPSRLCLYEENQYAEQGFPFGRFRPDQPIDWTRGRWLDTGHPVWLPALPAYYNFCVCPQERFCQVTSNGLAAGADLEDASFRAVLELVERDAFMITWLACLSARRVILDETVDAGAREVVRQMEERGIRVRLYLLDAGLSIPTVLCLAFGGGGNWPGVTAALGASMSPHVAIRKAILEQGHVGPYIRRLMLGGKHHIPSEPAEVRTLTDHALYYVPVCRAPIVEFLEAGVPEPTAAAELEEPDGVSLDACLERLRAVGVRVAVADLTAPDIVESPFRVVRALGLDLQPIHFGFKLRRLASVRLKAAATNGLNPYPHPLA